MLKRARERGGYDQLWQRDLLAQLQREEAKAIGRNGMRGMRLLQVAQSGTPKEA